MHNCLILLFLHVDLHIAMGFILECIQNIREETEVRKIIRSHLHIFSFCYASHMERQYSKYKQVIL